MILSDRTIRRYCMVGEPLHHSATYVIEPMIDPFCERTVFEGMSYGLSQCGYDIRVAEEFWIHPHEFKLASTIERFVMPHDIVAIVHDKSSWARRGIACQNTVAEPGWQGYLTLELTNHGDSHHFIKAGTPIAQMIFHRLDQECEKPYSGKYQHQRAGAVAAIEEK